MALNPTSGAASVRTMMMLVSSVGRKPFLTAPKAMTVATTVPSVNIHMSQGTCKDASSVTRYPLAMRL
jgi:hypothetical protein